MANKIGREVYVHGYIDEERQDICIIRNDGGYFGTVKTEITEADDKMVSLNTIEEAIDEIKAERDKCYQEEYRTGMGWGFQSALEILERKVYGRYTP